MTNKLLLFCWLIILAFLGGLPATGYASSRAFPVAAEYPPIGAGPFTYPAGLSSTNHSLWQSDNQPPDSTARPNLRFDCLTAADGLSFSMVTSILQDQRGFMWFGTRYGLDKFDGNNFSVTLTDPGADPMAGNSINYLNQDPNGDLWIATSLDLVRWDMKSGEFVHYYPDAANPDSLTPGRINAFGRDADGALLIGTNTGLNRYNPATDTFSRYLVDQPVFDIFVDQQGGIWLGGIGLSYYSSGSLEQPNPKQYEADLSDPNRPSSDIVTAVYEDHQGVLWVGTDGGGLNRLDRAAGKFIPYASAENRSDNPNASLGLSNNRVWSILEDNTDRLWIATESGLNLLDQKRENIYQYHVVPGDTHSLINDEVFDLYQDRSGVIWMATFGGICRLNEIASHFTHYQQGPNQPGPVAAPVNGTQPGSTAILSGNEILSVYSDSHGILWAGTSNGGLNRLDRQTGEVKVYRHDPADPTSISYGEVNAIYEDQEGTLWVGTSSGLSRFNPQTGAFASEAALQGLSVGSIVGDEQGNLWAGTWEGLYRREPGASAFLPVSQAGDLPTLRRIQEIYLDSRGALWISTQADGLYRLDHAAEGGSTPTLVHFPQDSSDPNSPGASPVMGIYEDRNGTVWLGSLDDGLVRFDRDTQTFVHFIPDPGTAREVTISRFVSCIQGDAQGYLWMGTVLGLARFDPRSKTFFYYDTRDGLVIGEGFSCAQSEQGEMFFGSWQGLNTFFPDQIQDNPNPPPVVITALNLNNQPLRTDLQPDEQVKLPYRENNLSFDFAALDFAAPAKNQYAYIMEGLDTDWVLAGTRRHADYPDLKPGNYTFRVMASNNSGVWNEQGAAVQITITPPFWQTWWFLGLVGVTMVGFVAGGVRLRLKGVERRSRELETQVANRTRELVALNEIAAILNQPLDLQGVLRDALGKTLEVMRIEAGGIYLLDEKTQVLTIAAHQGFSPQFIREIDGLQAGEGFSGHVIQSGESLIVRDVSTDPRLTRMVVREEGFHSLAVVALRSRDQVRGTLFALTHGQREFSDQDVQLLESIGHQVGAAIEKAGLYEFSRNQVAELTALQETAKAVTSTLELDKLFDLIIQQATALLKADGGFINLVDWDRRVDEVVAVAGLAPPVIGERIPMEDSLSGWATLHNQAIISNQIPDDERVAESVRSWVTDEQIQCVAVAPLTIRDRVMGTLLVIGQKEGKGSFVQADLDLLVAFANQAAIAIENARLYEQSKELAVVEERRRQELEALLSADDRMKRYLHQDEVLQALVDVAVDILHADKSAVICWDEKREKLVMRVARGFSPEAISQLQFSRGEGVIGWVVAHREPVLVEDSLNDPRRLLENPHIVEIAMEEGIRSFVHFPITIGEEVLGVFNVSYEKPHAVGEGEQRLFQALTQRAALYIENARLYEQSQEVAVLEERSRLARELHDAVTQTLFSASLVAEALPTTWEKDPEEGRGLLQELRSLSRGALAEMRTLLLELRPAALLETSLADLVRQLGEAASGRAGIPTSVQVEGQAKLPPDVHIAFYRIAQEALNNMVKHAHAHQATVRLDYTGGELAAGVSQRALLSIGDDGRGFDPAQIAHNRLGLGIMQERAQAIGATLTIESQPRQGTQVTVLWEQGGKQEAK